MNTNYIQVAPVARSTFLSNPSKPNTTTMLIAYDVLTSQKIRIAGYSVCRLCLLWFMFIFIRSRIFYSVPFSIRLFVGLAAFTSMVIIAGVLTVYFTASQSESTLHAFSSSLLIHNNYKRRFHFSNLIQTRNSVLEMNAKLLRLVYTYCTSFSMG